MERVLTAYVDGSFDSTTKRYGWGICAIDGEKTYISCGSDNKSGPSKMHNVAGEINAAIIAMRWAASQGYDTLELYYDYQGIEKWPTGQWKAKNEYTQQYVYNYKIISEKIKINFHKVKAHSGDKYNEIADQLAKKGLLKELERKNDIA